MSSTIKNLEEFIDFCDDMEIATESVSTRQSVQNSLIITFEHMIKLKYCTQDQNNSWFNSALRL